MADVRNLSKVSAKLAKLKGVSHEKLLVLLSVAVAAGCASSYTAEVSQKVVDGKVQVTYTDEESFDESTNLQRFAQWNKELSYCPSTYTVKSTSTTSDRFTITVMCD